MADINNVTLTGRLTADPVLRKTSTDKSVATFSVAVKKKNDESMFFDIVAWNQLADNVARYTHKGSRVAVTGDLNTRDYEKDGQKRRAVEIVAQSVVFLDPKKEEQKPNECEEDDLPF